MKKTTKVLPLFFTVNTKGEAVIATDKGDMVMCQRDAEKFFSVCAGVYRESMAKMGSLAVAAAPTKVSNKLIRDLVPLLKMRRPRGF